MRIAVASGKGGTGKTTVATNLATVASRAGRRVAYVDCDVEEPNGHIFLKPQIALHRPVERPVPQVDAQVCTLCGQCSEICQFSAIVCVGQKVLLYPEMCHSCGGCLHVCPTGAITEVPCEIGWLEAGRAGDVQFVHGLLNVGQAMSPPLIREVKRAIPKADLVFLDVPPGTSCPVIESVKDADFVLLVTEPTPFGLHDLKLAVQMVRAIKLPTGVVINRADTRDRRTWDYCRENDLPILAEIPDDRRIAEAYSRGHLAAEVSDAHRALFARLLDDIEERASVARSTSVAAGGGAR